MDEALENRVLWERPSTLTQISANPFAHGHTVVTGPDASGKRLIALISLYGALQFGLDLGDLAEGDVPERVTTHIDPLAPRPPHDVKVTREFAALTLSTLKESKAYLSQLRAGEVDPLSDVLHDASNCRSSTQPRPLPTASSTATKSAWTSPGSVARWMDAAQGNS